MALTGAGSEADSRAMVDESQDWTRALESALEDLRAADMLRATRVTPRGLERNFASNDYLGLSTHPAVVQAAVAATQKYGAGATGARLISGTTEEHEALEAALAEWKGAEAALVFSSGYMATLGVLQTLATPPGAGGAVPIVFDKESHACVVDAAMGARRWRTFRHNDVGHLADVLERELGGNVARASSPRKTECSGPTHNADSETVSVSNSDSDAGLEKDMRAGCPRHVERSHPWRAVVVTEGVFSMSGDMAPLAELLEVVERWDALLVVDDAHGSGTVGPGGRGSAAEAGVDGHPHLVQMGTLSKALGSQGGYVVGPRSLRKWLVNRARTFLFDTALTPGAAAAAREAVAVIAREPERLKRLRRKSAALGEVVGSRKECRGPIHNKIIGDPLATMRAAEALREAGFQVGAVRPPTVAPGTSRLRFCASSQHTEEQIRALADALLTLR